MQNTNSTGNKQLHPLIAAAHEHIQKQQYVKARQCYDELLASHENHLDGLFLAGAVSLKIEDYVTATTRLAKYLTLKTDNALAWTYFAMGLYNLKRLEQALTCAKQALQLNPEHVDTLNLKGNILRQMGYPSEAMLCYDEALSIDPNNSHGLNNKGVVLWDLQRFEESKVWLDKARTVNPADAGFVVNLANTVRDLGDEANAIALYREAKAIDPNCYDAVFNASMVLLYQGDLLNGFKEYEARWLASSFPSPRRDFSQPLWLGQGSIAGKTLLIHSEQGFGDNIQFCRYIPHLAQTGAKLVVEVEAELLPLLKTLPVDAQYVVKGQPLPSFNVHCPMMSLPIIFSTTLDTIPDRVPYLGVDEKLIPAWSSRLQPRTTKIGLAWSGNPRHVNDKNRSMPLATLLGGLPLHTANTEWIAVQKHLSASELERLSQVKHVVYPGVHMNSMADTAALISQLDLVITVDTAVAHLAGALGKEVWLLLPKRAEWRWMASRSDSPWYPSMRIFRQKERGDWAGVLNEVADALRLKFPHLAHADEDIAGGLLQKQSQVIAQYILDGSTILDVGRRDPNLTALLPKNCVYKQISLDQLDARHANTADLIVAIDSLELLEDVYAALQKLLLLERDVLITYCPTELVAQPERDALGWKSHLSKFELFKLIFDTGFSVSQMELLETKNVLMKISPLKQAEFSPKRVAVLSYGNVGNFGDRLGFHLVHSVLPANAIVEHFYFNPWNVPDLSSYDLLILGIGNSLFAPIMTEALEAALDQVPHAIGIFGTQYREDIDKAKMHRIISKLDRWYARHAEDIHLFGKGFDNVVHFGDWLIDAFPMTNAHDTSLLTIGDEVWNDGPLDRTIQRIQKHTHVVSTRLHPLLCALTSAKIVQYSEQREGGSTRVSGKFRSMLIDIFGRTYPENIAWQVDKKKVFQYKKRVADNIAILRHDIAYLLNGD